MQGTGYAPSEKVWARHTWYLSPAPPAVLVEKKSVMWRNFSMWQIVMWRSVSTWQMFSWRKKDKYQVWKLFGLAKRNSSLQNFVIWGQYCIRKRGSLSITFCLFKIPCPGLTVMVHQGSYISFSSGPILGLALQSQPSLLCPTSALTPVPFPPQSDLPSLYLGLPSPFLIHCAAISLFASTLGPMAGFFCSGFKRACNRWGTSPLVKDLL